VDATDAAMDSITIVIGLITVLENRTIASFEG
jgi:hypothetical protein